MYSKEREKGTYREVVDVKFHESGRRCLVVFSTQPQGGLDPVLAMFTLCKEGSRDTNLIFDQAHFLPKLCNLGPKKDNHILRSKPTTLINLHDIRSMNQGCSFSD
jgi:hypothetical protein